MSDATPIQDTQIQDTVKPDASNLISDALRVITNPTAFFRGMQKDGGLGPPLMFAVAIGVVTGVLRLILGILGMGGEPSFWMAIAGLVLAPIFVAIFGFLGAAIAHVVWNVLGSKESYETSYRCGAYSMAILPITQLFDWVPYLGAVFAIAWYTWLMIVAGIHVHGIKEKTAKLAFGLVGGVLMLVVLSMEFGSRKLSSGLAEAWAKSGVTDEEAQEARDAVDEMLSRLRK
ncbi:MAG: YIP1 family protein [Planctomycetota bacterium]